METYLTCRNPDCEKYRNIFIAGNELHANCKTEPLHLGNGEGPRPNWMRFAIPLGLAAATAAVVAMKPWRRSG